MGQSRRFRFLAITIIAGVLAFALIPPLQHWSDVSLAYVNLVVTEGNWRPLGWLTRAPSIETVTLQSGEQELVADLYIPRTWLGRQKPSAAFVIFTPFAGEGRNNRYIVNLAQTFARLGFVILVPERLGEGKTVVSLVDIENAQRSWDYLRDRPETADDRVGYFGLSYGLGPVILADVNAQPVVGRDPVAFLIGYGGYADLKNVMRFVLTGTYEYKTWQGSGVPENWVRDVLKENIERSLPPSAQRDAILSATTTKAFEQSYARLPQDFQEQVAALSPATVADHINVPLLLIHSTDDPVIPFTESYRLADGAASSPQVSVTLVNIFAHGEYKPLSWQNVRAAYIPSLFDSFRFLSQVLALRN